LSMIGLNLCYTLGTILGGTIVANLLFGIFVAQVCFYYRRFPQDQRSLKFVVAVVWFLELAHTVCLVHGVYFAVITQRGQLLDIVPKSFRLGYLFAGTASPVVQAFFTTRIAKCFHKPYLAILCWTMTFLRFSSTLCLAVFLSSTKPSIRVQLLCQWILTTSLVLEACVDLLIAVSLCYFLVKTRHHSVHKRTIRLLDKMITTTIRTGLFNSLLSIAAVVSILTMPENNVWVAIMVCQAKVSSNSMLASLNCRSILWGDQKRDAEAFGKAKLNSSTFDRSSMEFTTNINLSTIEAPDVQGDWELVWNRHSPCSK